MEVLKEGISEFLETGKMEPAPDFQVWKECTLKYPFFQALLFYYLKILFRNQRPDFESELHRLSPFVTDRKALFYAVFSDQFSQFFQKTGKRELSSDRTGVLLDAFFDTLDDSLLEDNHLEKTVLDSGIVSVDYFPFIEKVEKEDAPLALPPDSLQQKSELRYREIIDNFIEKSENGEDFKIRLSAPSTESSACEALHISPEDDDLEDSMFFTETLSRIYIKQKKYEKAYKIIKQLSLNYPEKNIYFADQIRFLEKLILNSSNNK